jgi:hypothetical protein
MRLSFPSGDQPLTKQLLRMYTRLRTIPTCHVEEVDQGLVQHLQDLCQMRNHSNISAISSLVKEFSKLSLLS